MKQFFMVYVWGNQSPARRHTSLKSAVEEAERLRTLTDKSIYVLSTAYCLEGLEPPRSEKRKLKDKRWHMKTAMKQKASLDSSAQSD